MHPTHCETTHSKDILAAARRQFDDFKPKQPNPNLRAQLKHGWMLPMLLHIDGCLWGRWNYWASAPRSAWMEWVKNPMTYTGR